MLGSGCVSVFTPETGTSQGCTADSYSSLSLGNLQATTHSHQGLSSPRHSGVFQNSDLGVSSPRPHPCFLPSVVTRPLRRSLPKGRGTWVFCPALAALLLFKFLPWRGCRAQRHWLFQGRRGAPSPVSPNAGAPVKVREAVWGGMSLLDIRWLS